MSIATRFLVGLLSKFTFFLYTLRIRISERFDIHFRKKHLAKQVISRGQGVANFEKIAIFAIYPQREMLTSTLRARELLRNYGFSLIFVVNRNPQTQDWISQFEGLGDTVLIRSNIGHDFGAYQAGISFLQDENLLANCQQLVLLNDSTIFTPKSATLANRFFSRTDSWQSLTFSTFPDLHSQSYFLSFLPEVFKSKVFLDFWASYYPTSIRHRVIRTGEIGLSRALIRENWLPHPMTLELKHEPVRGKTARMKLAELIALFSQVSGSSDLGSVSDEIVRNRISHQLYEGNPSQILGPYLARVYGFPLKRDLLYGRLYSLADILECLRDCGIEEDELKELRNLFLATLTRPSGSLNSLWRMSGLVR